MSLNQIFAVSMMAATLTGTAVRPSAAQQYSGHCPPGYVQSGPARRGEPGEPAVFLCKPISVPPPYRTPTPRPTPTSKYPPSPTPRPEPSSRPTIPSCYRGFIMPVYDAKHRIIKRYVCPPRRLLPTSSLAVVLPTA